jgi:hypothetical protein
MKVKLKKVLFDRGVLAALMSGRKYDIIPKNGDSSRKSNVLTFGFSEQSLLSKCSVVTELNMEKIYLQIMLSNCSRIS